MTDLVIVDYGLANLRSVQKAFERVGHTATISSDPDRVAKADKIVLPGVGAFRDAIGGLRSKNLDEPILEHIEGGSPFLGICLGFQLLFTRSHEDGVYPGLDVFPGEVIRFTDQPNLKVPHMGWNQLHFAKPSRLFAGFTDGVSVYFVHSYYPLPMNREIIAAESDYPTPFPAAIEYENIFATQFHPEKSQAVGMQILKNFASI